MHTTATKSQAQAIEDIQLKEFKVQNPELLTTYKCSNISNFSQDFERKKRSTIDKTKRKDKTHLFVLLILMTPILVKFIRT